MRSLTDLRARAGASDECMRQLQSEGKGQLQDGGKGRINHHSRPQLSVMPHDALVSARPPAAVRRDVATCVAYRCVAVENRSTMVDVVVSAMLGVVHACVRAYNEGRVLVLRMDSQTGHGYVMHKTMEKQRKGNVRSSNASHS